MIISHKHKFIYIKNHKVAGTSLEIALSKYCGSDDIIAPLPENQEALRSSLGYPGHRNFKVNINKRITKNHFYYLYREALKIYSKHNKSPCFFYHDADNIEHLPAKNVRASVPSKIWNSYLKIITLRCPYDLMISLYYFQKHQSLHNKNFEDYIIRFFVHWYIVYFRDAHIDGKLVNGFIIRYEHLDEDIKRLETEISLPGLLDTFRSINAKGNIRPRGGATACEIYSKYPKVKLKIDEVLYSRQNNYEFLRKYWPMYKAKLEKEITQNKSITYL